MEDRWYQSGAVNALIEYVFSDKNGHPIVVAPTGSGKTIIICRFCDEYLSRMVKSNILVLSHVKEILQQNHEALSEYFDGFDVGLYSSGLKSRTVKKITVAGIQSIWRQPELFVDFNIIIIDECHLVTIEEAGMYRQFFDGLSALRDDGFTNLHVPYIGLTATPFRLGHGYIHQGEGALFTEIVYDLSSMENYNRLVAEGYLSRLISKPSELEMNVDGIKTVAGDFSTKQLSERFDRDEITEKAVDEIIKYGQYNYKKWLIFAIDINHAEHIAKYLNDKGYKTCCVHSKMDDDRDQVISDYRNGVYRAAVNVDVMTTGLDVRSIDLIAQLCHTKSPVKHVQSLGRGSRVLYADGFDLQTIEGRLAAIEASPKTHCLVLDFAGNTERLGPINNVIIKVKGEKGTGEPITKRCPECSCIHHPSVKVCDVCQYVFQFKVNIQDTASRTPVVKEPIVGWVFVDDVKYDLHQKEGKGTGMVVSYQCGYNRFREWVLYDYEGYPKHKANAWVRYRLEGVEELKELPVDTYELLQFSHLLKQPVKIRVDATEKYPRIIDYEFE